MLSTIAAILSVCNGAFAFVKNLLGFKSAEKGQEDAATRAVEVTNQASRAAAEISRTTNHNLNQELDHADDQAADDLSRLHAADSLREQSDILNDAVARANQDPGADGRMR